MIRKLKKGEFGTYIHFEGEKELFEMDILSEIYVDENNYFHNINKPSLIWKYENGTIYKIQYNFHGLLHRLDGPAITYFKQNGTIDEERYGIFGKRYYNKQDWEIELNRIKMLEEI